MSESLGQYPDRDLLEETATGKQRLKLWWHGPHPFWSGLNQVVARTHASVTEVGEKRRVQLQAWIAIALAIVFLVGGLASAVLNGQFGTNEVILIVLAGMAAGAYILCWTPYYAWGGWLVTGCVILVGYLFAWTESGSATVLYTFIPLGFVLGGVLLNTLPLVFWLVVGSCGVFLLPVGSVQEAGKVFGDFAAIAVLLLVTVIFRNGIERLRLRVSERITAGFAQANADLKASNQRTHKLIQTLSDGVGVTDLDGNLVEVNDSFMRLAGYDQPAFVLGKNPALLLDEPDRNRLPRNFPIDGNLGKAIEYRMVRAYNGHPNDERRYDGEMTVSPLLNDQGQRSGFLVVVRDISQQKRAEEALRTSEARQRQILDTIPASILITHLPQGDILYANQTMVNQFGLTPEQVEGKTTPDLYYDLADRERLLATLQDQGVLNNFVARAKRQDNGLPFWGDLSGRIIDFAGERALLTVIIDITARRQAEDNLRIRDEILQKNSTLIAELSRSPNIINGNLQPALEEITEAVSNALDVQRASVWFFNDEHTKIQRVNLFERGKGHTSGGSFSTSEFPAYFSALQTGKPILADDARAHPSTRELSPAYLAPLMINSRLDAPIRWRGQVTGALVCDHIGLKRHWTLEEESFINSMADFVTSALEAQERVKLAREIEESSVRRGLQVQLSTQIAQEISTASDLNELFRLVVTLVKERFGYYHVQVLRYEPALNAMVLIVGYGEVGEKMLLARHQLPMGVGLIGIAGATGDTVLRTELENDPDWRPNPLLPETKCEISVPIRLRGQVLGVLDVQSDRAGALTLDDQILLEGLCGQVAVAIEETRLRREMEERLHELNALHASMSRQGWDSMAETLPSEGYQYDQISVSPLTRDETADQPAHPAASDDRVETPVQAAPARSTGPLGKPAYLSVPLAVHESETIGMVSVENETSRPLSEEELAFIEQVAEQVSLALESARLFAQTQATLGETEDLYQASAEVNAASTYEDVLEAVRKSIDKDEEAHILTIGVFDRPWSEDTPPQFVDTLAMWSSLPDHVVESFPKRVPLGESPLVMGMKTNETTVIEDVKSDPGVDESLRTTLVNRLFTQSLINTPLMVSGQWMGVLSVSFPRPRKFSETEIRRLVALASQAAVAINNMQLLESTRVRAQRERILREVTTRVRASVDADTILRTAVRELGAALGREAFIHLGGPEQEPVKAADRSSSAAVEGGK